MNGRSPVGSTSTIAPFAIAWVMSKSKPEIMVKSANAAPCTMIGLTVFKTSAAGTTPRAFISCSIHPGGGDAALGGIEHEHAADIARAGELVVGTRKYAAQAIEIIARGEAVFCDQRLPARLLPHAGRRKENLAAHGAILPPLQAASMQAGMDMSAGR